MRITEKIIKDADKFTEDLNKSDKDRFFIATKNDLYPGALVQFTYNAKHKDTLTFWDGKPAIIVLKKTSTRMLGLNLHFVPFPLRKMIAEYIVKKNLDNIKNNKRIFINYTGIKAFLIAIRATICIRSYILTRTGGKYTMVKNSKDYILGATLLKTQKLYKMSSDEIYKIALGSKFSTKKKSGDRRYNRAAKKKAFKK